VETVELANLARRKNERFVKMLEPHTYKLWLEVRPQLLVDNGGKLIQRGNFNVRLWIFGFSGNANWD